MAQEMMPTTLRGILDKLLPVFEKIELDNPQFKESLEALQGIHRSKPVVEIEELSLNDGSNRILFHLVATCLNEARILMSDQLSEAFSILADVSRKPRWRQDLGKCESHSTYAGWPPNPEHESNSYSHEQWSAFESESILQVAVRTLHPRHARQIGQAAYHAIRLISNCCADNDANKRVVLECGGLELLFRCANLGLWPDTAIAALWNICAESETQADLDAESAIEEDGNMSTIACTQLALRSSDGRRHTNTIKELLDLADIVKDQTWKEMVAELLEKTSWSVSCHYHNSSTAEAKTVIPSSTRLTKPDLRPEDFLAELLTGSGWRLAMSHPECNCDVARTIAILLTQEETQRELIREDLVRAFLEVPNWKYSSIEHNNTVGHDVPRAMAVVLQSLFKSIYDVSALPEFAARYTSASPQLVSACINALGDVSDLRQTMESNTTIPAASACIVLANLTRSTEFALRLVQLHKVHLSIGRILHQREDSTTLFPAIALLDRLAIPLDNKFAIIQAGVIYELPRLLIDFDVQPMIQREAVSLMRKVIVGVPEHVSGLGVCIAINGEGHENGRSLERTQKQSGLLAALNLFRRTSDAETKIEVGRLVVEVCRTLLHSTRGNPELAENAVHQALGSASDVANPISHLTCNGTSQGVRGEGWFGLAVLSTWEHGRPFVMDCLGNEDVQKKMEEALKERERALCQNISLMLTKLHLFPSRLVLTSTRLVLERAASSVGLPPIWPVMASAA